MSTKKCPYCGEEIQADAVKCRYCREWLVNDKSAPGTVVSADEIETEENIFIQPVQKRLSSAPVILPAKVEKKQEPLPRLKRQNFRSGIILQSVIIVLWFLATPYMSGSDALTDQWGFFLLFPLLFFCAVGGFWMLYVYLQNFQAGKPVLRLTKTFTIGAVAAFFLIMILQMVSFSGFTFGIDEGEDVYLSLLSANHPADIAFRLFLLLILSYAYMVIGWWLVKEVDDFVGGLKPLGYMMCIAASVFLLYVFVGVAGFDAVWILSFFFYFAAMGVSVFIINVFNKASSYVHFTGYAPYTFSAEKKTEPSLNSAHIILAVFAAALLSGIAFITNSEDGISSGWFTRENETEELSAPVIASDNDSIQESLEELKTFYGISYYYNINYPEDALLNTSGVDSLIWNSYTLSGGTKIFYTKGFLYFDEDGRISTYKELNENGKVTYTVYYTINDDILSRCTYFDYTSNTYFADELISVAENKEVWHRKYTQEEGESSERTEVFELNYIPENDKMSVGYYSYYQDENNYITKVFDKDRKLLSTLYSIDDKRARSEINEYNNFGTLTGQKTIKNNNQEERISFSYKNDPRGNWVEKVTKDNYNRNTSITERIIYYRK